MTTFVVTINKSKWAIFSLADFSNWTFNLEMLVIDEEEVQHIQPSITYLEQAEMNLPDYMGRLENELSRRVNKDDLIQIFTKYGMFRTYTMRE